MHDPGKFRTRKLVGIFRLDVGTVWKQPGAEKVLTAWTQVTYSKVTRGSLPFVFTLCLIMKVVFLIVSIANILLSLSLASSLSESKL